MSKTIIAIAALLSATFLAQDVKAQGPEGVLIRCGPSSGHSYFFKDDIWNPDGPNWDLDGISDGKIILIRYADEWDILFSDGVGASGYRQDGAKVVPLLEKPGMLTIGVFNANYIDIFTFDFDGRKVAWSSNKHGPFMSKVAAYEASCD